VSTPGRVELTLFGQTLTVRTEAPAEYIRQLAGYLEERVEAVTRGGMRDPLTALTLAALDITDELFRAREDQSARRATSASGSAPWSRCSTVSRPGPRRPAVPDVGVPLVLMVTLETERLLLRAFRAEDFEPYAAICADPEVMRYLGEGRPLSRSDAWRQMAMILGHWRLRGYGLWAVEERATGTLVGRIGFFEPEGWPDFELGWMLGRHAWGKGYATEGARRALAYAFTELGRDHLISLIRPGNDPSIRVAERLGETLRGQTELFGHPALVYGIDRARWRAA